MGEGDSNYHPLRGPALWIAGAIVVGVAVASVSMFSITMAVIGFLRSSQEGPTLSDLHSEFADQSIDAGFEEPQLLADDPLLARRIIVLGHDVNARTAKDVIARLLYLDGVDSDEPIDLYITTLGGWGDNAFSIIDAMHMIESPVNTWAVGACYSSGAMILTAGTGRRHATSNAIIMVHANSIESDEKFSMDALDAQRYRELWRDYAQLPEEWFPMTFDEEYYLSAEQALGYGLIDEIVPAQAAPLVEQEAAASKEVEE